jgi:hypothetical protein
MLFVHTIFPSATKLKGSSHKKKNKEKEKKEGHRKKEPVIK